MKVVVCRGLPGSGKSTWADAQGGIVCSADHWFKRLGQYHFKASELGQAHRQCLWKFQWATGDKSDATLVIVDNTNTTCLEMQPYIELAETRGHAIEIREFKGAYTNIHGVPDATLERMRKRWEAVKPLWEKYATV